MSTKIEWANETWNPITGCTPISGGCLNCYAKRMSHRLAGRYGYPKIPNQFKPTFHADKLMQPVVWKKPKRIFVCSMGDIFHPDVKPEWIGDVWDIMARCPQHTFLILTKRPENAPRADNWWFPNIWIGVTAENQKAADQRTAILSQIPAAVRFVSVEPMLSRVKLSIRYHPTPASAHRKIDWVICGAETGPGARPMEDRWAVDLFEQCESAGVPFFFKKESNSIPVPDDFKVRNYPK